jgi:hypothetical protein
VAEEFLDGACGGVASVVVMGFQEVEGRGHASEIARLARCVGLPPSTNVWQ